MKANFDLFLSEVLKHEGGYVDHPKDPGGATNLGITIGTLSGWLGRPATKEEVRALTVKDVAPIYKRNYWDKVRGDDLPSGVDTSTADFAVNSGVSRSAMYLQEVVGVAPDGKIGPLTIAATKRLSAAKIVNDLCDKRLYFLRRLSTFQTFGKGWTTRVAGVRKLGVALAAGAKAPVVPAPSVQPTSAQPLGTPAPRAWAVLIAMVGPMLYGIGKLLGIVP